MLDGHAVVWLVSSGWAIEWLVSSECELLPAHGKGASSCVCPSTLSVDGRVNGAALGLSLWCVTTSEELV
jgi:hypothetical protein